jgi:hypothetical protein
VVVFGPLQAPQAVVDTAVDLATLRNSLVEQAPVGSAANVDQATGQVLIRLAGQASAAFVAAAARHPGRVRTQTPEIWVLTTYVICAYYVPGLAHHDVQSFSDSTDKSVAYVCVQKVPVSVGWEIQSRAPGSITASTAMPTVAGSQVAAQEAGSAVTSYWSLLSRTTCVLA